MNLNGQRRPRACRSRPAPLPEGAAAARRPCGAKGFTVIEILVVIALILVLMSMILVALNYATRAGQRTNTIGLMNAINQGLVQFERDIGYLPPVLDEGRNLAFDFGDDGVRMNGPRPVNVDQVNDPDPDGYRAQMQRWYSITSLADYLLGYGPVREDGYDGLGIRHPSPDGYWGTASNGLIGDYNSPDVGTRRYFLDPGSPQNVRIQSQRFRQGQVFGPYIQLRDERLLGAIDPANPWQDEERGLYQVYLPGDALPDGLNWDEMPKVILDYWGQPIRYYRRPYPAGGPGQAYRVRPQAMDFHLPTLSDFIVLRPWEVREADAVDSPMLDDAALETTVGDPTTTRRLQIGSFALFSNGPDRSAMKMYRRDTETAAQPDNREYNRDNIVEIGQ